MSLQSEHQLDNTQRKLSQLEELLATARVQPGPGRESEVRSLSHLINELREEIVRYQAATHAPANS